VTPYCRIFFLSGNRAAASGGQRIEQRRKEAGTVNKIRISEHRERAGCTRGGRCRGLTVAAVLAVMLAFPARGDAQSGLSAELASAIDRAAEGIKEKIIACRRDLHEHPELSNREFRTAKLVADRLEKLGIEVKTGVAHTGVVGLLRGGKAGPVVALRADMDALPVEEKTGLPFASTERGEYNGAEVGIMHACGHDIHTSVLLGVAEVLAGLRDDLPGTVKFIFQPAEEGAPAGEQGGASLMIREGVLENPRPEAVMGLHVTPDFRAGQIGYRPRGVMASSDGLRIRVTGVQSHGAAPWDGVDPIVVASQIVLGLQTIVSRQIDPRIAPAVVTIGMIQGGVRSNIIPEEVRLIGTIRSLDPEMRKDIHERVRRTAENIALSAGAKAEVSIGLGAPVTYNDPELTARMVPVLERVTGEGDLVLSKIYTFSEDFAFYAEQVPSLFVFLGVRPDDVALEDAAPLHSPYFVADEKALVYGVRALASMAAAYLSGQ